MSIDWINIFLFLAAAQGFFLTVLIFHKYGRLYANRFLGLIMLFYSTILLNLFLMEINFYQKVPFLFALLLPVPLLVSPLHFLYARFIVQPNRRFQKSDGYHLIPFVIYLLFLIIKYFVMDQPLFLPKESLTKVGYPLEFDLFNWAIAIQGLTYFSLTILVVQRHSKRLKNAFSSIEKIKLSWLRNITLIAIFVLGIFILENMFMLIGINFSNYFNFTSVLFAIAMYTMGYMGLFKSEIFASSEISNQMNQLNDIQIFAPQPDCANVSVDLQKYEKSGLTPEKARKYTDQLQELMQVKKIYQNSNLTLSGLAGELSISPHNLSEVLNTQLNQNFFDFVNHFRVEEAKQALTDPSKAHLKILAIAFEAGFNSKTAFNMIFKKHTRQTPSEYRKNARKIEAAE